LGFVKALFGTAILAIGLASSGCSAKGKRGRALPPLNAPSWRAELPVPGFAPAIVALPLGATGPRPIVVVIHGARDRADWQCGSFRGLLGGRVFIVCPQGLQATEAGGLYGLGSFDESSAELRGALAALKARFGKHVAPSPVALIGYAEGAAVAADLARQEPRFFARVALVNGDPSVVSSSAAKIFNEHGGKRVLFFCTSPECQAAGGERALWLSRTGAVTAKAVEAHVGPYLDAPFLAALKPELVWLLEGDKRFAAPRR
jgi:poly(3-hydroxybutyrate) depolymerase